MRVKTLVVLVALVPVVAVPGARADAATNPSDAEEWARSPLDAQGQRSAPVEPLEAPLPTSCASPALSKFTEPFTTPPLVDMRYQGGSATITAKNGQHQFHSSLAPTPSLGYVAGSWGNDVYGGPTLVTRRDQTARLTMRNRIQSQPLGPNVDPTLMGAEGQEAQPDGVVHLHGGATPPASDGLPTDRVPYGSQFTYTYPNRQEATGLWYHDHSLGMTRLNNAAGLAGQYWLRDDHDTGFPGNPLGLPTGRYELPLTLQDRAFNADGTICYPGGPYADDDPPAPDRPTTWAPGYRGDVAIVNGKAWPNLTVDRGIYRFRVLNASNTRFWNLNWASSSGSNPQVYQIGSDGGLFNAPLALTSLVLAPSQRADLLIDFGSLPAGTQVQMANTAPLPFPGPPGATTDLSEVMRFTVGSSNGFSGVIPTNLRQGREIVPLTPVRTRYVELNDLIDDRDPNIGALAGAMLNNQRYTEECPGGGTMCEPVPRTTGVESPNRNTVEEWVLVNTSGVAHPIHLHMIQFQILNREGLAVANYVNEWNRRSGLQPGLPSPTNGGQGGWPALDPSPYLDGVLQDRADYEQGWHDTVIVPPRAVTRILVPWGGTAAGIPASFTGDAPGSTPTLVGDYVWHCHILEHEDNDMMQPLHIND